MHITIGYIVHISLGGSVGARLIAPRAGRPVLKDPCHLGKGENDRLS